MKKTPIIVMAVLCTAWFSRAEEFPPTRLDLAPQTDIFLDMCYGPHDPEVVKRKLQVFKELGFERVYFVAANPGYPQYGMPFLDFIADPDAYGNYARESVQHTTNINRVMIRAAHEAGLEAWPVFKPYEGGVGRTLPVGEEHPYRDKGLPDVGGTAYGYDSFILENPHMRLARRPGSGRDADLDEPLTRIELAFCIDSNAFHEKDDVEVSTSAVESVSLWVSDDNGTYTRYTNRFAVDQHIESRVLRDANGWDLRDGEAFACRVVTLHDFEQPVRDRFAAVTFDNPDGAHVTIPFSMIHCYSGDEAIPITVTRRTRPLLRTLGTSWEDRPRSDFRKDGFEFEYRGWGGRYPGWDDAAHYGIARGKNPYLKGLLCEAYPEVRAYWLDTIRRLLDYGADGIDIRLVNHSGMVSDFANYGFNEPVMREYERRRGHRRVETIDHYREIMKIRGEFFMQFLESARGIIEARDRAFQLHMHHVYLDLQHDGYLRGLVQWGQPKLFPDWRRMVDLADEITIKSHYNGHYRPEDCGPIKDRAYEQGKPVWIMCYLTQGPDLQPSLFAGASADPRITGVIFYETVVRNNPNFGMHRPGIVGVAPDRSLMLDEDVIGKIEQLMGP